MFNLEEFVANPSVGALTALQKKDWASLAIYYELEPRPTLIKTQLQKLVLEHFIEEEVLDRNEVQDHFSLGSGDTEEARLSLERERVKLEILREQNKAKELSYLSHSDKYLPCFDEGQPETFFSQFEKNAAIHRWPPGTWAVLLSNVFTGEAQRAYAGLSVDESLDYATVKSTILRVYKRVPAYYRKIFRTSQKRANQTCVEFYREKLAQCHRWVDSAQVENNYQKLLELIAYEEVKSCMPDQLQSYLEGLGIHDLDTAGPASDHYLLTYPHVNFRNKLPLTQSSLKLNPNPFGPREPAALSPLQGRPRFAPMNSGESANREIWSAGYSQFKPSSNSLSCSYCKKGNHTVDRCFLVNLCAYCKKSGHIRDHCPKLAKNPTRSSSALLVGVTRDAVVETVTLAGEIPVVGYDKCKSQDASEMHPSYKPYCFPGSVSPDDSLQPSHSVTILRDSGSVRTFVLREAISSFPQCQTGHSLVVRGLFSKGEVPLCKVFLQSAVMTGYVSAGIVDELPVAGVSMILGNDVAGSTMFPHSQSVSQNCASPDQEPSEVSPACVVTRSNSRRLVKDSLSVPQVANPPPENNIVSYSPNPKFSLDEFFNSASQESNVLDQTSSSEPVMRSITDMAVTRTTLIAEQAKDPSLKCLVVTSIPDVEESDITKCSHLVVPNDNEEERADSVVEPVLQNSEVLKKPGEKLAHLQEEQAASIVHLLQEHVALFSDSPSLCPLLRHDVDVQASHPLPATSHYHHKAHQVSTSTVQVGFSAFSPTLFININCPAFSPTLFININCPVSSPTLSININCPVSSPTLSININCPATSPTLSININCPATSPTLSININCPATSPILFININCPASSPTLFININCPVSSPTLFINITCPDNESHKLQPQLVELKELMLQLQAQNNQSQEIEQELLELKEIIVEFNQSFATLRSTAPNVDFVDLLAKDCVHLDRSHKTWEDARANCISLGGDLFVAGDYEGAREYLKKDDESDEALYYWPWVGVKGKSWLDGQQVTDDEWDDDSPGTNDDSCSFLNGRGLGDSSACSSSYSSLCVKGTNYQSHQLDQVTEESQCTVEGEFYVNDNCSISVCQHNVLLPYQGSTAPNVDFSNLLAKDCIHLERSLKTWEEARANCISLGGDLFVAGDYVSAREYLKKEDGSDEGLSYWPWVGVKGKSWLDGQQVTDDEWDDDSPGSNNDSCSFLHGRGLEDLSSCSRSFTSLCVRGSNYHQVTEDSQCTVDGEFYVNDNCSISVCQHNVLLPYQGSTAPNVDFVDLLAKDCVHLDRSHKTWEDARANCISLGGDLFVAGDYEGAREYLKKEDESDEGLYYWPWVGVKGKSWLDGQQVTDDEWDDDSPETNDDSCSFLDGRGSTAPNVDFSNLLAKDCVHLERSLKTWEEARANCISLGGDLFVAGDYVSAREYLKKEDGSDEGLRYWPWVGVKGKSWLDGQQVTDDEWDDDSPGSNNDSCSFLHGRGLEDVSACSRSFTSLCVRGSNYHQVTEDSQCTVDGEFYVNDNCSISVCQHNVLLPYQGSTAPNVDFVDLLAKDCVHLDRSHKTWEDARANCISLGGDLFVAGDYEGAREYLKKEDESDEGLYYWPWVGVKGKSWLDGQQVTDDEWDDDSPETNDDSCSFLDGRGLKDSFACSSSYSSLCVKGTNYQSHQLDQVTEESQCTVEGEFYVNDNCSISVCQHNVLLPYQGSTAPNVDFSNLLAKDCVHLERSLKTWEEARANCISLGGDLFVAGDYVSAREYLKKEDGSDEGLRYWPWVGVKGKSWLDGQQVTDDEWDDDSPGSNNDSCSFLHGRGLEDVSACSRSFTSLCVRGSNYQSLQLSQVTEDSQCTVDGEFYVNDNCSISVCQHNVLLPYQGSTAPNVDFSNLLAKDCIHLERSLNTWEEARANCISLGGDLFVAGDYVSAKEYLKKEDGSDEGLSYWPWVGVKGKSWLDGQQVTDDEWDDDSPGSNNDSCSFLHGRGLEDLSACSRSFTSLCVRGSNYHQVTEDSQCTVDGEFYVNDNCSISVCQHNVLLPYQGSTAPNVDFSNLLAKDCIHLERSLKTWEEARANCISLGGDLFVAGDYVSAKEYLKKEDGSDEGLSYWPWVGVKGKSWLDGQQVTDDEWDDDSPGSNNDSCSFLHGRGLEDLSACSRSFTSLCVRGSNYHQVTEDSQCTVDGEFYVNDNCSISVCQHNVLLPYQGSTAPNVDFSDLLAKDCVHLDRSHKTWEDARANCISLGGDLFVAGDYEGAREYLKKEDESDEGLYYWPWVGVKGKSWLDGQQVTDDEWDDDSPETNDDSCSFLHGRVSFFHLLHRLVPLPLPFFHPLVCLVSLSLSFILLLLLPGSAPSGTDLYTYLYCTTTFSPSQPASQSSRLTQDPPTANTTWSHLPYTFCNDISQDASIWKMVPITVVVVMMVLDRVVAIPHPQPVDYTGWQVLRLTMLDGEQEGSWLDMSANESPHDINILTRNKLQGTSDVAISPSALQAFTSHLAAIGATYSSLVTDLGKLVNEEQPSRTRAEIQINELSYQQLLTYQQITEYVNWLASQHPDLVIVEEAGRSVEGRAIPVLIITSPNSQTNKSVIFIEAGVHAREWVSPLAALKVASEVVSSPDLTRHLEWRIMPLVNPDGYLTSWTTVRTTVEEESSCPGWCQMRGRRHQQKLWISLEK
ncbi:hypothetical protein Pcinc_024950 [Petrolisthes cinctipes]|uniref:Uncharacterized protein n=1 Tax=Petrolisthes cinctipes TaxID=88211 RepID=A0AAE1KCP4_PETCI|nr:hypothetical protein Pcinc_024950 [Petrolisthes cinctipes]